MRKKGSEETEGQKNCGSGRRNKDTCRKEAREDLGRRWVQRDGAHLLVAHLPIGFVPKAQHLPHHNPKAPHVTSRGEDPVGNGFRGCPSDGDLSSLIRHRKVMCFRAGRKGEKTPVGKGWEVSVSTCARIPHASHMCACRCGMNCVRECVRGTYRALTWVS